jgi:hypothetical protein
VFAEIVKGFQAAFAYPNLCKVLTAIVPELQGLPEFSAVPPVFRAQGFFQFLSVNAFNVIAAFLQ